MAAQTLASIRPWTQAALQAEMSSPKDRDSGYDETALVIAYSRIVNPTELWWSPSLFRRVPPLHHSSPTYGIPPSPDIKGSFLTIRLVRGQSEFAFLLLALFPAHVATWKIFFWHSPSRNPPEASDVVGPLGTCRSSLEFLGGEKIESR